MRGSVVKKGNRHYVVTRHRRPDGTYEQQWHGGHRTKREAEAARAEIVNRLNRGGYVEPTRLTLGEFLTDRWLPVVKTRVRPSTYDSYVNNIKLHVLPELGAVRLQELTPARLNTLYAHLLSDGRADGSGGLSPKSVRHVHTVIHTALRDAADEDLIPVNMATKAKPPRSTATVSRVMSVWTADQLSRFLAEVGDDRLFAAWRLAATTGLRRGEVLGLRWEDVDLDAGRASIRRTLLSVNYRVVEGDAKTDHGVRVVDLDSKTVAALRSHRTVQARERLAWGPAYQDSGFVFCREDGRPIHPDRMTQMFDRSVRNSGLPRIRLHDLRHTHATLALKAGVPVKVISERLGHANVAFTMQTYAHAIPGMQAEAAELVASIVDA